MEKWTFGDGTAPGPYDQALVRHCFVGMRRSWPQQSGTNRVEVMHRRFGNLAINAVRGDAVAVTRSRSMAEDSAPGVVFVNHVLEGGLRVTQGDRTAEFGEGDLVAFDGARPFYLEASAEHHLLSLRIPYELVGGGLPHWQKHFVMPLNHAAPLPSTVLATFMHELAHPGKRADVIETVETARALAGLFCAFPSDFAQCSGKDSPLRGRFEAYLASHFSRKSLRPATIALDLGVPLRRLHEAFNTQGSTCMSEVYAYRLERARSMLLASGSGTLSMTAVASACGFATAAHFSRQFAARFGYPPRALAPRRAGL